MLILANIFGAILIVLLYAGLWTILSGFLGGMVLLGLTALEGNGTTEEEVREESLDRLLEEVRESSRLVDAISAEIESIQKIGSSQGP